MAERIFGGALTGLLHCVGRKQPRHGYRPHLAVLYAFCVGLKLFGAAPNPTSSSPRGEMVSTAAMVVRHVACKGPNGP